MFYIQLLPVSYPLGLNKNTDKIQFHPYFTAKDILGFAITVITLTILTLKEPYILRDPDNFKGHYEAKMCGTSVVNTWSFHFCERDLIHKYLNTNENLKYSSVTFHTFLPDNELKGWNM